MNPVKCPHCQNSSPSLIELCGMVLGPNRSISKYYCVCCGKTFEILDAEIIEGLNSDGMIQEPKGD